MAEETKNLSLSTAVSAACPERTYRIGRAAIGRNAVQIGISEGVSVVKDARSAMVVAAP